MHDRLHVLAPRDQRRRPRLSEQDEPDVARLSKRLDRERKARAEAEAITGRVTAQLYETIGEVTRVNDKLQAVNQMMLDFVAIASHDLRGPITAISGFASILGDSWEHLTEEKRRECVGVIGRQARHLGLLVEDLMTVSQIEAGAVSTRRAVVDLAETIDHALEGLAARAAEVGRSLPADLAVLADPEHVHRIVVNYIENALKYGGAPIEIRAVDGDGFVDLRVTDGGSGVPEEFVERLFGRFARADDARSSGKQGTGLGLSIVRGLAQANGGDAWYEPNEPTGSCFVVRLPKGADAVS